MFAQWISWVFRKDHEQARREPVLTLGSAPLEVPQFQAIILGQLGEPKLEAAIGTDISSDHSHAKALDADTKGPLRDIHRRVATTILFESSGGQVDKVAHLPEIRFALGEPEIDTTSIDNAAHALEAKAFFISRIGSDGFKIYYKATIRKAVSDRRASLDDAEVRQVMRSLVKQEFDKGASISLIPFPEDGTAVQDSPKLTLVIIDPESEWNGSGQVRERIAEWTKQRGKSPRLYPGSLVWCLKKPGRDLRDKVELSLAWKRVANEVAGGTLGADYDRTDRAEIQSKVREAEEAARDEVWAGYRFAVLSDNREGDGLKVIDLGAGHASAAESLCGRVISALKSQALLNESVGAGYIERNWPPALKESGAWPLASLRQSFLNGALTRLPDPDAVLRTKIPDFVLNGDFGLASGPRPDGTYDRLWFGEPVTPDEVGFEAGVFLLTKAKGAALKGGVRPEPEEKKDIKLGDEDEDETKKESRGETPGGTTTLRLVGTVPSEVWNKIGTKLIPKLRSGSELKIGVEFSILLDGRQAQTLELEIRQILDDLGLTGQIRLEK